TNFLNTFFPSCYQFQYALCVEVRLVGWYAHDSSPLAIIRWPLWSSSIQSSPYTPRMSLCWSDKSCRHGLCEKTLQHNEAVYHISAVIGWIYFVAWSVFLYPQIYINFKRKSVVGLNFDFLALNVVGFILYGLFNCGLYWITEVENEYFRRYPKGLNPVQINDIVFALHATFATTLTITQCFIYERANQKVSWVARGILSIFAIFLLISVILASTEIIDWLDFLYYCSYVKLCITLIKYIPQAFMNYRRKSTVGWSIGNIFLDFTGGMFSMLQMILNSYNYTRLSLISGEYREYKDDYRDFETITFSSSVLLWRLMLCRSEETLLFPIDISSVAKEKIYMRRAPLQTREHRSM
ncbi:hypothetical protein L9F63_027539, partial [Diploptera punctata]